MSPYKTKRERLQAQLSQLKAERQSFEPRWKRLGEMVLPTRPRFATSDSNRGDVSSSESLDSTATYAAHTLESGMSSGITSPARPWFRLSTPSPELNEVHSVKEWLHLVTTRMAGVIGRSNLYQSLSQLYSDIGTFGTAALYIEEHKEFVIHSRVFPIGSYWFSVDAQGKPDTFAREVRMTVKQIVKEFCKLKDDGKYDLSNLSTRVRQLWAEGQYEQWIDVVHQISPNPDFDDSKLDARFKRFESIYYEASNQDSQDLYLRQSGYDLFPVLIARWKVTDGDVYATSCPGMTTLPDIEQLQIGEARALQGLELMVNPPMVADPQLQSQDLSILPGNVTYIAEESGSGKFRPAFEVRLPLADLEARQERLRERILRGWFANLFMMFENLRDRDRTKREIDARDAERLLALGPILERLNGDLLDPMIDLIFHYMMRQSVDGYKETDENQIPEPPEELEGRALKVDYISILAQAQKSVALGGIERFTQFLVELAASSGDTSILDKVDFDQSADEHAEALGVSPRIVRSDEKVAEIREARAQAQAQAQQLAAQREQAAMVKDLSQADTSGDNALTQMQRLAQAGNLIPQ